MNKATKILLLFVLFVTLIAIRGYLSPYLYDPLRVYFKGNYRYHPIPSIQFGLYFFNVFLRYTLNTIVSLAIIYVAFESKDKLMFSIKFYVLAFVLLSIMLFVLLKFKIVEGHMLIFYVRRFLIQPLFVFILLPAFYYQKLKTKN